MSDRVAIIGGKTVGRDHTPYPPVSVGDIVSVPQLGYPFGFNIRDFCFIFYVVRQWKITIDMEAYIVGRGGTITGSVEVVFEPNILPDFGDYYDMTRESEVVLTRETEYNWSAEEGYSTPGRPKIISESFSGDLISDYLIILTYTDPLFNSDTIWFNFGVRATADGDFGCESDLGTFSARDVGTFTFGGYGTVPMKADVLNGGGEGVITCDISITPELFWAYATKSGSPVYDTDTGEVLNDPLS